MHYTFALLQLPTAEPALSGCGSNGFPRNKAGSGQFTPALSTITVVEAERCLGKPNPTPMATTSSPSASDIAYIYMSGCPLCLATRSTLPATRAFVSDRNNGCRTARLHPQAPVPGQRAVANVCPPPVTSTMSPSNARQYVQECRRHRHHARGPDPAHKGAEGRLQGHEP